MYQPSRKLPASLVVPARRFDRCTLTRCTIMANHPVGLFHCTASDLHIDSSGFKYVAGSELMYFDCITDRTLTDAYIGEGRVCTRAKIMMKSGI